MLKSLCLMIFSVIMFTANAQQLFSTCVAHGGGDWDHSAMVKALELTCNEQIRQSGNAAEAI